MKRLFFVFMLIAGFSSLVFSQNWFIGGGVNLGFNKDSDNIGSGENYSEREYERGTIGISPEIGYKVNKFDFGIKPIIQYRYSDTKQEPLSFDDSINTISFGAGIFSRYNFITFFDKLSILGRMDLSYLYSKDEHTFYDLNTNTNDLYTYTNENIEHGISLSVSPIIEFKISDRIKLYSSIVGNIASIGYKYVFMTNEKNDASRNSHNFLFSLPSINNLSLTDISLGFYVTF